MTLEEAIKHCDEVVKRVEKNYFYIDASEHRQLAEWLKVLKEIWDSGDCNDCRNGQCEWKPKLGQLVRYNCPHYVGIANEEVNADESNSNLGKE